LSLILVQEVEFGEAAAHAANARYAEVCGMRTLALRGWLLAGDEIKAAKL